jgi:hypothetical protein
VRTRVFTIVLAVVSLVPGGCATGFRVGGNHYGAGVGGYIGPVPDAVQHNHHYPQPPL